MSSINFIDYQTVVPASWLNEVNRNTYVDRINVKDAPFNAVGNGIADDTAALQAAIDASDGREIYIPAGTYRTTGTLTATKAHRVSLVGEKTTYTLTAGSVINYQGSGIAIQMGADDGNPDSTGPARDMRVIDLGINTTTGSTAIRMQNTALGLIQNCVIRGFNGKVVDCRANVLLKIRDNDIAGINTGSGCYGIWLDDEYFGNFVTEIYGNHIFQVNWAIRCSEGRSLVIADNTMENLKNGTGTGGVVKFETSGYISEFRYYDNYVESQQGWAFEGSTFTGAILFFILKDSEFWGSGDALNVNPGFGNIPRTRVLNHDISGNLVVDSNWNAKAFLALPSVYPSTNVFDSTTTIVRSPVTNKEYEEDIKYALAPNDLMLQAGDFSMVTGGTAGTMIITGAGATPAFWTNLSTPQWQLIPDTITGTWVCYVPNTAADFDRCSRVFPITPVNRTRYFAIGFTTKGWSALSVDGVSVYDSGALKTDWHTEVITFTVAPNAASFTLKFMTNAANPFYIAEARLYEIGSAEYNEPGTMNNAITKAVKSLMKRGAY